MDQVTVTVRKMSKEAPSFAYLEVSAYAPYVKATTTVQIDPDWSGDDGVVWTVGYRDDLRMRPSAATLEEAVNIAKEIVVDRVVARYQANKQIDEYVARWSDLRVPVEEIAKWV